MLMQVITFLSALFKRNFKAALLGVLLTPIFFYSISAIFGVSIKDHLKFLGEQSYEAERNKLVEQLQAFNHKLDEYEIESHKKQQKLWLLLAGQLKGDSYGEVLGISNRNQDVIRALLEFGKIYTSLVKANAHSEETHERLSEMYESILYIITHDTRSLIRAFDILSDVNRKIEQFPKAVRDDVQIEVLRYLSYCAAKLEKTTEQETLNSQALTVKSRFNAGSTEYRRKLYWIDLSRLTKHINLAEIEEAESVFNELRGNIEHRFLKTKLIQHRGLIKPQFLDMWDEYIGKLS